MEQLNLNIIPGSTRPVCHVSQYDVGRTIRFNLFEGSTVYTLAGTETAEVHIRKPDNTVVTEALTVAAQSYLDVVTTQQMTACAGANLGEIQIKSGGNVIGTINFIMEVEADPLDNGSASSSQIYDLQAQINAAVATSELALNIEDKTGVLYKVNNKVTAIEEALNINGELIFDFIFGQFNASGYQNIGDMRLITVKQVFQPGVYTITAPAGLVFNVFYYNSDSSGTQYYNYRTSLSSAYIDKPFVITVRHASNWNTTYFSYSDITALRNDLGFTFTKAHNFINGADMSVVAEFYIIDTSYKPAGIRATSSMFRMRLKDSNNNVVANGYNVAPEYYSDMVQKFVDPNTGLIVGYYVLHYTGTDYEVDSNTWTFTSEAQDVTNSPKINEYLNRTENLVLIGDSIFGFYALNILEPLLVKSTDKLVYNCGFGGCRMSWTEPDGSDPYDAYTFVSIVDSIISGDYSAQFANMNLNQAYPLRVASLSSIDWSKPTTLFINYVNNDITGDVPIGDFWDYQNALTDYDKQKFLDAFNYGIQKLLTQYPHVKVVEFTAAYRKMSSTLPPYAFVNNLGLKPSDYNAAMKENAERIGISVYDLFREGGRNFFNGENVYQFDNSHYNEKGYKLFSKILTALLNSFID